ncbi:MAG: hypothetical protein EA347_09540 [Thioalkalivibrio sp.]|nr:MAG: hypothetical protein EA347_09540 [Thioalkalivibrio sp.]
MGFDSGFWNNMAHAFRNTRAVIAALGMLVVLGVLLYAHWAGPEVVSLEVIQVPVIAVEREGDDAQWVRVSVETPEDGVIRLLWMDAHGAIHAGGEASLRVTAFADGTRDYRLLDRP